MKCCDEEMILVSSINGKKKYKCFICGHTNSIVHQVRCFLTHYYNTFNQKFEGVRILAFSIEEAQKKVQIHNQKAEYKLFVSGELIL